ncbi:MAG TPA: Asp-tRNA(Asn)/Glu-tRNA(Gln) amidotransferase subunit GatA [Chitinophagaceae bacterium]
MTALFRFSSIQDYHAQLLAGTYSCEEAVHFYLRQIEERPSLNAYVRVYASEALQRAKDLDSARKNNAHAGRLHGVVIALKDIFCYKDHPVSAASRILENFTSIYNATVVEKLLNEEAIIIGHVNCDEFAMGSSNEHSVYGKVLNPLDESRVPGGSSGGSAAAVAANQCMISLGSDTGGSVRQPADFCGLVGLKPSYGRISRYGLLAYASSFDHVGIIGRSVPDVATVLEVIAGKDKMDGTSAPEPVPSYQLNSNGKSYRVAYFNDAINHPGLDPDIRSTFLGFFEKLREEGHQVEGIDFEFLDHIIPAYYILTTAEASSNLSRYDGVRFGRREPMPETDLTTFYKKNRSAGFGAEVKRRILLGTFVLSTGYYDAYFEKAQRVRKKILEKTKLIFNDFDAVILPVSPEMAFKPGEKSKDPISMYLADIYTVYANLTGVPAISVPLFRHANGLPYGPQIMMNRFQELSLLQFAHQLMQQYKSFDN